MSRLLFVAIIFIALILRAINLDYNSPFNDEAIYAVIGFDGVYKKDWETLDAFTWMAGSPYVYPVVNSVSYKLGGIEVARFVNVLFGIGTIYLAAETAALFTVKKRKLATAFITLCLLATLPLSFYVSRLATYDAPSFMFIMLGLYLVFKNFTSKEAKNEYYLFAAIAFFVAFVFKYLAIIYAAYAVLVSLFYLKKAGLKNILRNSWFYYFFTSLSLLFGFFIVLNFTDLFTYISTESAVEITNVFEKIQLFMSEYVFLLPFAVFSFGYLFKTKDTKTALVLLLATVTILIFHFGYAGAPSYEKHLLLSGIFMAVVTGVALPEFFDNLRASKKIKGFVQGNFIGFLGFLLIFLFWQVPTLNSKWRNVDIPLNFLASQVKKGDVVLVETGDVFILGLYDKLGSVSTVTFDYIDYLGSEDDKAYVTAIEDGYFNYIELEDQQLSKLARNHYLNDLVAKSLADNYKAIYNDGNVYIYERRF
ncbi:hypothetical protein A3D84_01140 [Candidatus Woesebacteria bacterium RIFCSPHIGHO2_02_FULL_42_20]|uniref:Glycosyltransferase RgtA/B/C/D-like domain-containing protein n=1 Tax=Candidatus Woesebacteria bacterium RIFCSPHIGHO2_12_FULL_41_24 TaxID=1802510 RepID=A0A1F8ARV8_9BACT|nr:MAG: hypothetical protein A2W15_05365 [Candidatus Woesebacteria bacterium RBG_16_41_13]OGM30720.1 MAG: hypothetical protein A2873_01260 [Candidatus Woesebacteria bacterium RIFCSPHIGHO2_01_FULL_42_80]OGM35857.1 MAG: hypothetical protein A3D84_01140 [Candidatus Woesebacteria bacterium RIFCSPHIGHO2_02_FULL_42_20]OGM53915.1 MAG: hypothetical protein A3E44_05905 [Candidatus Woesebacteria bacterium RIFCSPHIGHO2_12_FULL_41_24]OGM66107.1 MAG: hypothetical protein A2969_04000 [Candidatus Woesebacteri